MIESPVVPPYIYAASDESLSQGDVLQVEGQFLDNFKKYYPSLNHRDDEKQYVLVMTQSCDLVKTSKRRPKIPHINVCLIRPIRRVLDRIINEDLKPATFRNIKLLARVEMDELKGRLSKLINNNDQKMHFFLPKNGSFKEDMVGLLHMSFSFRTDEHYDEFLQNRVLSLKPEFQAKLGHIISQLYGRIATSDLSDSGWETKATRCYLNNLLENAEVRQVPDKTFIDYLKEKEKEELVDFDTLVQECQGSKRLKQFEPLKNELLQDIKKQLLNVFDNPSKVQSLLSMDKKERSKEIMSLINPSE